jgi:hypothetical protein
MDFSTLVPARVARRGSSGLPVTPRVTAYTGSGIAVSAAATLAPVIYLPENTRRLRDHQVNAELGRDETLSYHRIS